MTPPALPAVLLAGRRQGMVLLLQSHQGMLRQGEGSVEIREGAAPPSVKIRDQKTPKTRRFACSGSPAQITLGKDPVSCALMSDLLRGGCRLCGRPAVRQAVGIGWTERPPDAGGSPRRALASGHLWGRCRQALANRPLAQPLRMPAGQHLTYFPHRPRRSSPNLSGLRREMNTRLSIQTAV